MLRVPRSHWIPWESVQSSSNERHSNGSFCAAQCIARYDWCNAYDVMDGECVLSRMRLHDDIDSFDEDKLSIRGNMHDTLGKVTIHDS